MLSLLEPPLYGECGVVPGGLSLVVHGEAGPGQDHLASRHAAWNNDMLVLTTASEKLGHRVTNNFVIFSMILEFWTLPS